MLDDEPDGKATAAARAARRHVSDPRAELYDDLREDYELVRQALRRNIEAEKEKSVSITCKHCRREGSYRVPVDDPAARNRAVEMYLNQAQGMPGQARPSSKPDLRWAEEMSEEELWELEQMMVAKVGGMLGLDRVTYR